MKKTVRINGAGRQSSAIISGYPILVLPKLAVVVGLNEAIILQQIHFWTIEPLTERHVQDEHVWVYNTATQWNENFPWLARGSIARLLRILRKKGLVIATSKYNQSGWDKTLWYRVDHEKIKKVTGE